MFFNPFCTGLSSCIGIEINLTPIYMLFHFYPLRKITFRHFFRCQRYHAAILYIHNNNASLSCFVFQVNGHKYETRRS